MTKIDIREGSIFDLEEDTVTVAPCAGEPECPGGYKVTIPAARGMGAATVTLIATDSDNLQGVSSFTLRKGTAMNPPLLATIPSESVEKSKFKYGPVQFVVDDMNEAGDNDALDANGEPTINMLRASSDNEDVVAGDDITFTRLAERAWDHERAYRGFSNWPRGDHGGG
ncbi:MAG TPA: hypothetical protein VGI60_07465 [Chthoniobacterales bacterium]|jgi:hypothetical protein